MLKELYLSPPSGWELGVCLNIVGSGLTSCGLVMQKYSHSENARKGECVIFFRQPLWILGLLIFIGGQVGNVVAMAFAPQTMLSCLGALSLVWNALFARFLLKETVLLAECLSMMGMMLGVLMVVSSTPVMEDEPGTVRRNKTVAQVVDDLIEWEFFAVVAFFTLTLCVGFAVLNRVSPGLEPIFWAFATAVAGGYTVTLFKCSANVLARVRFPWSSPEFYVLLAIAVVLCLAQVHTLNLALKKGNALTVVPVYFSLGVLMQLLQAEVAFEELDTLSGRKNVAIFISGVGLVLACIFAMVHTKMSAEAEEESPEEEVCEEGDAALKAATPKNEYTPLLKGVRCRSEADLDGQAGQPRLRERLRSMPHLDPGMFKGSFQGVDRRYTISVTGPIGIG